MEPSVEKDERLPRSVRRLGEVVPGLSRTRSGFTLIELLAVVTIIAILTALIVPALNKATSRSHTIACLGHLKQLQFAWHMYTDDHAERLPPNDFVFGRGIAGPSWCPGNARTDKTTEMIEDGLLFPYIRSTQAYRCPSDGSLVETGAGEKLNLLRTRSYGMSSSINAQTLGLPHFKTLSDMTHPAPGQIFVFIDVHEDSITDAQFALNPSENKWISLPADRHNRGANLSFADGHVELWKWETSKKPRGNSHLDAEDLRDLKRLHGGMRRE